jgi:hypothetical protein
MEQRFLSKVNKTDGCWLWTANKSKLGYGQFAVSHHNPKLAHRVAYELWNGKIPNGLCIRHTCDEPSCVNPAHLLTGTIQDNMNDRQMRGRGRWACKLTDDEVNEIRVLRGFFQNQELAIMYQVSNPTISSICKGHTWKHLT